MSLSRSVFKTRFAQTESLMGSPLDLRDMREKFGGAMKIFAGEQGLILFLAPLKLPTSREQFMKVYKTTRMKHENAADAVVQFAANFAICLLRSFSKQS